MFVILITNKLNLQFFIFIVIIFFFRPFCFSQNTYVPDDKFEQSLIDLGYDVGPLDDFVPTTNISSITELYIYDRNISDLTGIEDFVALSILNCENNNLTDLNVTQNTNLTQLFCRFNQLTGLNTSQNIKLGILWVEGNQLSGLDVSKNVDLISLITSDNPLNSLDVTLNTKLTVLWCLNNLLISLDVSKNTSLDKLYCDYNFLTALDVSKNTLLTDLSCGDNFIPSIDISQNINLIRFWCTRNQLTSLDVTKNINLNYLTFGDNQISTIDLSKNTKLIRLWAARNILTNLDITNNLLLEDISAGINNLTFLDVSRNINLTRLRIDYNDLCSVNIKNGNNHNFVDFSSSNNPNLSCILVDDVNYSIINWINVDPVANFVISEDECNNFILVDYLDDFIGASYTLPMLINGNYYTQSGGNGTMLNAGDIITSSQTIYIYNETSCDNNETSFSILITDGDYFIPKYFTPNNDGSNDSWAVLDNTNSVNNITIYNKYGKLLKFLPSNSLEWDGTFNGKILPSDDYWYVVVLNSGEALKGHFALKR